jgi:hypothetical protein
MVIRSSSFEFPGPDLIVLQRRINGQAKAGSINFAVRRDPDTQELSWSVVFCDGPRRATVQFHHEPSEADLEDLSTALRSWANYQPEGSAYTTEVPKAP